MYMYILLDRNLFVLVYFHATCAVIIHMYLCTHATCTRMHMYSMYCQAHKCRLGSCTVHFQYMYMYAHVSSVPVCVHVFTVHVCSVCT